jgi:hypothetical protein
MGATTVIQTDSQLTTNYDYSKVFIGKNTFENMTLVNISGGTLTYTAGTLLGRITTGGKVQPLASGAVDGSQIPVGILAQTVELVDDGEATVTVCVSGEVATEKVILNGSDTMATNISGRPIKDRIAGDTLGIKLIAGTELTNYDNS